MGKHNRCCVGGCNNDRRYSDRYVIRSHVKDLQLHKVSSDVEKKQIWEKQISMGRENFNIGNSMRICSNHFTDAQPTHANPNPTLYLTESDTKKKSPVKGKARTKGNPTPNKRKSTVTASCSKEQEAEPEVLTCAAMTFEQLTRESDVRFYTGFRSTSLFKFVFNFLLVKAVNMRYWKGDKQTQSETMGADPFLKP